MKLTLEIEKHEPKDQPPTMTPEYVGRIVRRSQDAIVEESLERMIRQRDAEYVDDTFGFKMDRDTVMEFIEKLLNVLDDSRAQDISRKFLLARADEFGIDVPYGYETVIRGGKIYLREKKDEK